MTVRWTRTALRDLESLHAFIQQDRPNAAAAAVDRFLAAIDNLPRFPESGRPGRVAGTRELVVRPFLVVYRIRKEAVELVAILHAARRWPESF